MLLPEMQRRNKVGGLVDRRIGEGDPGMTAEERAVQRFAQEKTRKKGASLFDLEASDDDETRAGLTHGGRSLDDLPADDFGDSASVGESEDDGELMHKKRRRSDASDEGEIDGEQEDEGPERKKSKKEVMEEVIAKSKFHKYERQKAKEDDEDLREELDNGMQDVLALLQGHKVLPKPPKQPEATTNGAGPTMDPDRQRLLDGMDRDQADKEYDARIKQLAQDARAKPSERTKTAEEKIREEAERLKKLEERRTKRMRGEEDPDDEKNIDHRNPEVDDAMDEVDEIPDEAADFGFTNSDTKPKRDDEQVVLEDEDEFALNDDLIASGSDVDVSSESEAEDESDVENDVRLEEVDEEDEFVKGILGDVSVPGKKATVLASQLGQGGLAYTYPCPRSHQELLKVLQDTPAEQLPTIIQRIRALHHPSLSATNKEAMADFSSALVDHLSHMALHKQPMTTTEQVIRHLHSLSRTYPETIANAFRRQLQSAHERKDLHAGDLLILTAIGSIYPTSDHFHQVVTPAMTLMAKWLGMNVCDSPQKHATGMFLVGLCVSYQKLSKRYVPEAVRFTLDALNSKPAATEEQRRAHIDNLMSMADLWKEESAFIEIYQPFIPILRKHIAKRELNTLEILLQQARLRRRPLELHHHRPQPIRTSIPKFEEGYNPDKHYDPDKERSDAKKLQKEYKRERKGALRELRKDANFVARQQLGEKRARDAEYEKKYRRLVAEIQGEEGHEARGYEREKRARKGKR